MKFGKLKGTPPEAEGIDMEFSAEMPEDDMPVASPAGKSNPALAALSDEELMAEVEKRKLLGATEAEPAEVM